MHEMVVSGEIKALGFKEGSSGIFTGSIEGLYQGYRLGSTLPDERCFVLDGEHGSIALVLRQEICSCLAPRPADHPFADGKDPFKSLPTISGEVGLPHEKPVGGLLPEPPGAEVPPGMHGGPGLIQKRPFYMQVILRVDPEKSTGIFAGAAGEIELHTPDYRMPGHLVINTRDGDLWLNFLEGADRGTLRADLWVDGSMSTGIYQNARGDLKFALAATPPNFGRGPYWGTIWLEQEPPAKETTGSNAEWVTV
jgi:hypothetical protein